MAEKKLFVTFGGGNPAVPGLHNAWADHRVFETGFASTRGQTSRLAGVTIQSMAYSPDPDESIVVMTLLAESVDHQPVK